MLSGPRAFPPTAPRRHIRKFHISFHPNDLLKTIQALVEENHAHLVTMGVSHPALEAIKTKTKATPFGLSTKLTGAGGGGCAVTLVPDDFKDETLQELIETLSVDNFDPYMTSVGGSGLGVLSPYGQRPLPEEALLATPDTPEDAAATVGAPLRPLRAPFEKVDIGELGSWTDSLGRWLFV